MKSVVKWSVILAILVTVVTVIVTLTGLHKKPVAGQTTFVSIVTLINIVVILLALKETTTQNAYGKQLLNGALIGVIGGALIFLSSWFMLSVVFPDSLDELREGYTGWLQGQDLPQVELQQKIDEMQKTTAASQSATGFVGTFLTSLIVAAIVGLVLRRKGPA